MSQKKLLRPILGEVEVSGGKVFFFFDHIACSMYRHAEDVSLLQIYSVHTLTHHDPTPLFVLKSIMRTWDLWGLCDIRAHSGIISPWLGSSIYERPVATR